MSHDLAITDDPDYCHAELTEHRHAFVDMGGWDGSHDTAYELGVLVYIYNGEPVYPYPYTKPAKACRHCGRPQS